jgi:hypothetical protein
VAALGWAAGVAVAVAVGVLASAGCATYQDELASGQRAFEASEHERALAIFRALEPDTPHLAPGERAQYAYLRGMTDFRMGYRAEARHWLSVAGALEEETPGALSADWRRRMADTLKELNEEVYAAGIETLSNTPSAGARAGEEEHPPAAPDAPR